MHYNRAPITEALIDISVVLSPQQNLESLRLIYPQIKENYPREELRSLTEGEFQIAAEPKATVTSRPFGYAFHSTDGRQVIQARLNGFTFSRLEPYETWERLRDEGRRLWSIYVDTVKPERVAGIALRYINKLVIPLEDINLAEYLNIRPEFPDKIEATTSEFFFRVALPQADFEGMVILAESSLQPPSSKSVAILLDLWAYKNNPPASDEDIWSLLETMRSRKNIYFEAAITDRIRELIR